MLQVGVCEPSEIVTSIGSINHIPPRPALIVANKLSTWPEVSIKPPSPFKDSVEITV